MPDERVKVEALVYAKKAIGHITSRTTAETHCKQVTAAHRDTILPTNMAASPSLPLSVSMKVAVRPMVGVVPEMNVRASASRAKPIETPPVGGPIVRRGAGGLVEREGMATPHTQKGPKATKPTAGAVWRRRLCGGPSSGCWAAA